MSKPVVEYCFERIEREKQIKIPRALFNSKGLTELERAIETRNPFAISRVYKEYKKYFDLSKLNELSSALKKERNRISEEDKKLISKLITEKRDPYYFFEFVGNLWYLSRLIEEMKQTKGLSKNIKVSLLFWIYLNITELLTKYISDLIKEKITLEHDKKRFQEFIKKFKDGQHPEIGSLIQTIHKLNLLTKDELEKTTLVKSKFIRNIMSHANMYYDDTLDKIILSNGNIYNLSKFEEDCARMYEFLQEIVYIFNGRDTNLIGHIEKIFAEISKKFKRVGRTIPLREFSNIILKLRSED